MTVAIESGVTPRRWRCTRLSGTPWPSSARVATQPRSSCQIPVRSGSASQTAPTVIAWSSCSTTQATAWVSARIQRTCSGAEVG